MYKGDLSNRPAPRLVFVWEGVLAHPLKGAESRISKYLRKGAWEKALSLYTTDSVMSHQLWRLAWNYDFGLDVATYLSQDPGFVDALRERLDAEDLPIGHVNGTDTLDLAGHRLIHVQRVFDNDERRTMMYGSKGRRVDDPRVFDPLY